MNLQIKINVVDNVDVENQNVDAFENQNINVDGDEDSNVDVRVDSPRLITQLRGMVILVMVMEILLDLIYLIQEIGVILILN